VRRAADPTCLQLAFVSRETAGPFSPKEREAWDAILEAYRLIRQLGLSANVEEIVGAVHVMQSFVIQHALHWHWPGEFSDWFSPVKVRPVDAGDEQG
jgi:hypothetical protein